MALPPELTLIVLSRLPFQDIVRSRQVCHAWKALIESSKDLLYLVEMSMAGFKLDGLVALGHDSAHDRLQFIKDQEAWRDASFAEQEPRHWLGRAQRRGLHAIDYTLTDGVLTSLYSEISSDDAPSRHHLKRSRLEGTESTADVTSWMLPRNVSDTRACAVVWNDSVDAIVYLHLEDVHGFESSVLYARSLNTGEPHAEARPPDNDDTLESDTLDALLAISPNHCILSHSDNWVTVVNWRTRKTIDEIFIPKLTSQRSIRFLSETSFIVLRRPHGGNFADRLGLIDLYDFAPKIDPSSNSHVATFLLPRLNARDAPYRHYLAFEKSSTNQFVTDDCIIAFRSRRLNDLSDDRRADSHLFITPKKSFLSVLNESRSSTSTAVPQFQWGEWGLPGVRCIPLWHGGAVGIIRDRALLVASWRERYLLDFNQRRVKHALCANSNPELWPSRGGCSAQTKRTISTIPEGFVDPLEDYDVLGAERLPFAATPWRPEDLEPPEYKRGIVMDDKHVVFVGMSDPSKNGHYKFPVYTHALVHRTSFSQPSEEVKSENA